MVEPFKILVFCPIWKRRAVLEIWWAGVQRLQTFWPEMIQFIPFAIVSNEEDEQWAEEHGITYTYYENQPLADKQNAGLKAASKLEWDYLIQTSSDNLLTNTGVEYILPALKKGHTQIGFRSSHIIHGPSKKAIRFELNNGKNRLIGGNRLIKREACEALKWQLWQPGLVRGLDFVSQCALMNYDQSPPYEIKTSEVCGIGIKTAMQITPWKNVRKAGKPCDIQHILAELSSKEKDLILSL